MKEKAKEENNDIFAPGKNDTAWKVSTSSKPTTRETPAMINNNVKAGSMSTIPDEQQHFFFHLQAVLNACATFDAMGNMVPDKNTIWYTW